MTFILRNIKKKNWCEFSSRDQMTQEFNMFLKTTICHRTPFNNFKAVSRFKIKILKFTSKNVVCLSFRLYIFFFYFILSIILQPDYQLLNVRLCSFTGFWILVKKLNLYTFEAFSSK